MSPHNANHTQIDWEEYIVRLTAFASSWARGKLWFRGGKTTTFLMGKEAGDYALEAICRYLENPDKYEQEKGELLDYLKYNLISSFIANDLRKSENTKTSDIFHAAFDDADKEEDSSYYERLLPHTVALFPDEIDYSVIKEYIEKEVKGDRDAENIFLGIYSYGMRRREVIDEFSMSSSEFDNGMRRLNTIINRTAEHFNKNKQPV